MQVNPKLFELNADGGLEVRLEAACEVEMDEQWSYVGNTSNQRWLWYAVDHATNTVLAYVFGKRKDDKLLTRKTLCFSKLELMHDTVIGLLINKVVVDEIFMLDYRFHPLPFFALQK